MRGLLLLLGLVFIIAASAPHRSRIGISIENASQYDVTDLRLHEDPEYGDALNVLDAPLRAGETIELESDRAPFITFIREKYERGPLLAFTTARAIDVEIAPEYRVTIFDESFRVEGIGDIEAAAGCACSVITAGK